MRPAVYWLLCFPVPKKCPHVLRWWEYMKSFLLRLAENNRTDSMLCLPRVSRSVIARKVNSGRWEIWQRLRVGSPGEGSSQFYRSSWRPIYGMKKSLWHHRGKKFWSVFFQTRSLIDGVGKNWKDCLTVYDTKGVCRHTRDTYWSLKTGKSAFWQVTFKLKKRFVSRWCSG